jgi:hypothetical protein
MKLTEKILAVLILAALILKFLLIPFGGILIVLSLSTLSIIYYPLGFAFFNGIRLRHVFKKEAYKETNAKKIIGAIATGICLSTLIIGVLFKLQNWPGANSMLLIGLTFTLPLAIFVIVKFFIRNYHTYYKKIMLRMCAIGGFAIILFYIPTYELVKIQYRNKPTYIKAFEENELHPSQKSRQKLELEYMRTTLNDKQFKEYEDFIKSQPNN